MKVPWFLEFKYFCHKKQYKAAKKKLLWRLSTQPDDSFGYIVALNYFSYTREWKILRRIFFHAFFIFPDSSFVKETLMAISVRFFVQGKWTAHIISEHIIPTLTSTYVGQFRILFWLSQYFLKRKVLDSALFYNQLNEHYHAYASKVRYALLIQQLSIWLEYHNYYCLKKTLQTDYPTWMDQEESALFITYLLPHIAFFARIDCTRQKDEIFFPHNFRNELWQRLLRFIAKED